MNLQYPDNSLPQLKIQNAKGLHAQFSEFDLYSSVGQQFRRRSG
jgi:hypothetical protein